MKKILHIKSATVDALAEKVISAQREDGELSVEVVDLNVDEPDYRLALEKLFDADTVSVW